MATLPEVSACFPWPHRADLKPKLFLSNISIGDKREVYQGDGHYNQRVAVAISAEFAERMVTCLNSHDYLLAAAEKVLDGLNARLDAAAATGAPHPVFQGIADLHDAINRAKASARVLPPDAAPISSRCSR